MTINDDEVDFETLRGLGERIRSLRTERDLTLTALSALSQISVAMLSHIERGKTSPSLKLLNRLRVALGVPLASFFDPNTDRSGEESVVTRVEKRSKLSFAQMGLTKELLSPPGRSDLELLILSIEVGGGSGPDPWRRVGEKGGIVLEGRFELQVGEKTYVLEEGDAFQFDSTQPHSFRNLAQKETRVIWVIRSNEVS
ncbi:helix-turn-helix transcriptional regulator [Microvirga sp. BT689]|uniref:helix-turn-helix domain-containing protein n=1 Tax=Microvirga arvi TaxID=2778731 RepID=UPI001950578A|nr:XRE family transcriptional regulator [Microvirga arvi]MBM6581172.1 helix-turn-helix transcriptional regulator [Microvirga arvi]